VSEEPADELLDLLALCTEAKRLQRADKESGRVHLQVDGPDLFLAAVSTYNVVLDLDARRVQHGCRDFLTEARSGRLCKHVAALLLAIDREAALAAARGLTDPDGGWHLEVIGARFGR
jgi:hypothetical protein